MVGATPGNPDSFGASGNGPSQPPPAPPNWAEVLAAHTELLRQLVQVCQFLQQQHFQPDRPHNVHHPQVAGYQELNEET